MALELKQSLKLSQQLVMTPQLQQAIKLLALNRLELTQHCMSEMMENPMLEESVEIEDTGSNENKEALEASEQNKQNELKSTELNPSKGQGTEDINWENYLNSQSSRPVEKTFKNYDPDLPSFESNYARAQTLTEHLVNQIKLSRMIASDLEIGFSIIGNLDDDGYLRSGLDEIAQKLNCDVEDVEAVLTKVQEFDPLGVGARNLQECLLIQAKHHKDSKLLCEILKNHMSLVEKKDYSGIAKLLNVPKKEIFEAMDQITNFDPKPARQYYDESSSYITPDIYVHKVNGDYIISLNEDGLPRLKISNMYQSILQSKNGSKEVEKEYINDKLRSALWLIRSIHQRQRTIYKVTESIVKMQKGFLDLGVQSLKPMVLRDVAQDIGMHESTVSRVTSNKYVHTPQGIFELKFFFTSGIKSSTGNDFVASEAIKDKIKALITHEDHRHPYSDQELVELLRKKNIDIARRTVAKYREMLGFLSSSKRKQAF